MSGHSKWSTIKHKKAAEDAKRGAVFTKIGKKIHIAVKKGGSGDPEMNPALRQVIDEARYANMPLENIKRAIEKASGANSANDAQEVIYEGYGPNGVGFMVTSVTDNRNRTSAEVKSIFEKAGGSMGGPGSVSYMRNIQPVPMITVDQSTREACERMIELFNDNEDVVEVWCNMAE